MRIYMVMTVLAPIGGIEAALVPLACQLQAQGHEVIVYTLQPVTDPNQNAKALDDAGIEVLTPPGWLTHLARWGIAHRPQWLQRIGALLTPLLVPPASLDALIRRRPLRRSLAGAVGKARGLLARQLAFESLLYISLQRAFRRRPPDVVHVHGWGCGEDPPGALHWLRARGYPTVYTEHNSPDPSRHAEIPNAPMNQADVLIAVSEAGRVGLQKVGQATRPIVVIPYSVEPLPPPTAPPDHPGGFTITCIARLAPQKGHAYLLSAMAQVVRRIPQARLLLAGAGPLREELEAQARARHLEAHVQFLGIVPRAQLPDLLARTDVVVLPSLWEGLPVTLIEAMSAGKACVVSDVGGNGELIADGENGLVVPPADPDALAQALIRLARDEGLRRRMGQAGRRRFDQGAFSPATVTARTMTAYQMAIASARKREHPHVSLRIHHHPHV